MLGRKNLAAHFEPSLTWLGAALALGSAAYLLAGMILLGSGYYEIAAVMFVPLIGMAARLAYLESVKPHTKFPQLGKILGIFNAVAVVAILLYLGVQLHALSKV